MGATTLSSRAIIGEFYRQLEQSTGADWVNDVSMMFTSDQSSEEYKWLGQSPAMREWIGGRQAKGFLESGVTIDNKHFEATIEFLVKELRRDKTPQIRTRIAELAERTNAHWASLLSTQIINGESTACYDGQFFFDTDHVEGDSGTQSNDISVDISALPTEVHGTTTAPSVEEMQLAIDKARAQIEGFLDNRGEPMNEMARSFRVLVPTSLTYAAERAVAAPFVSASQTSMVERAYNVSTNPRLNSWTTKFAVFRADGSARALIRQEETGVMIKAKAEGSEYEFDYDAHQYGVDTWRNVGYGYWQHACLVTLA